MTGGDDISRRKIFFLKDAAFGHDLRYRLLHGGVHHRLGKSLPRPLGSRLDCVSHIGELVIGERENLGESDRGEIVKTTSVMFGVYITGIKLITSFWSQYYPN